MNHLLRPWVLVPALALGWPGVASAVDPVPVPSLDCAALAQPIAFIRLNLEQVAASVPGGIFTPKKIWWAVVDRAGVLCAVDKIGDAWPDSHAIAIAKAGTANGFSNDGLALSTANLYAATQPGGALYGLNNSNTFHPDYLPQKSGIGFVPGGIVTFGGGVALYSATRQVIGGFGVSGDTPCIEHAIAYRMRAALGLNTIPLAPAGFPATDNIIFPRGEHYRPSGFEHPRCAIKGGHRDGKDDRDDKDDDKDKRDKDGKGRKD